jgi:hypothetical protein
VLESGADPRASRWVWKWTCVGSDCRKANLGEVPLGTENGEHFHVECKQCGLRQTRTVVASNLSPDRRRSRRP